MKSILVLSVLVLTQTVFAQSGPERSSKAICGSSKAVAETAQKALDEILQDPRQRGSAVMALLEIRDACKAQVFENETRRHKDPPAPHGRYANITNSTYMNKTNCGQIRESAYLGEGSTVIVLDPVPKDFGRSVSPFDDLIKVQIVNNTDSTILAATRGCVGYFPNVFVRK